MAHKVSKNDRLIKKAEGIYDKIDDVMDRLGNLLVVDLPDGSMLLYDVRTTDPEIETDIAGRHAVGIVDPIGSGLHTGTF